MFILFDFFEEPNFLPQWLYHFSFLQAMYEGLKFFTCLNTWYFFFLFFRRNNCVSGLEIVFSVVLYCIFLMISNSEYLLKCLLTNCISSLIHVYWRSLLVLKIALYKFLCMPTCRSFLYILIIYSLSDVWSAVFPPVFQVSFSLSF